MQITKGKSLIILPLRFLVYLCLSLAIILLSGLLETTKLIHTTNDALFFQRYNKPLQKLSTQQYETLCGSDAVQADLSNTLYLLQLKTMSLFSNLQWKEIQKNIFEGRHDKLCFQEKDIIYSLKVGKNASFSDLHSMVNVQIQEAGATSIPEKYPEIGPNQLAQHQDIKAFLSKIEQRSESDIIRLRHEPVNIRLQQWKIFTGSIPGIEYAKTSFIFNNHLYKATVETEYQQIQEEIPNLKKQCLILGIIFLIIGILGMTKLYRSVKGVKLITNTQVLLIDVIIITILAVLGFMGTDHFLTEKYNTTSLMGQEGLLGTFSYIPIILILPIIVSWMSARGILVNEKGILDSDMILQSFMAWDELSSMELMDDTEFSGRRKSYKVLFMHTVDENAINISGNIREKAKIEIKDLLLINVPDKWKHEMRIHLSKL